MTSSSKKIGDSPLNTISLEEYRRWRDVVHTQGSDDVPPGQSPGTFEHLEKPPVAPSIPVGKILGTGRWDMVHVDIDKLPVDGGEGDGGIAHSTVPPPVLPSAYVAEPKRPDFKLLESAWNDVDLPGEGDMAKRRRAKARDALNEYEDTFSEWWYASYMMLVFHAASRADLGGQADDLSYAFREGRLIPVRPDAPSLYEEALASRFEFLHQGLGIAVAHARLEIVSRAALIFEHVKYTMSGDEERRLAQRLRDVCMGLLAESLDERDRVMAAIALQRVVTVTPDIRTSADIKAIAETYLNSWTIYDRSENIALLEAMHDFVMFLSHSGDDLPVDDLVERMRQSFTYMARKADSNVVKKLARERLNELNAQFEPRPDKDGFGAPITRMMRPDPVFQKFTFSRDRSRELSCLGVYFNMQRMAHTYDHSHMAYQMGHIFPPDMHLLLREASQGDTASRAIASVVMGYIAANKIHPEYLFTHIVPMANVLNVVVPDLATQPLETVRAGASLVASGMFYMDAAGNERPIERVVEVISRTTGGLSERKRANALDDAFVSRALTMMGAELIPFAVKSYRELLGRLAGERMEKHESAVLNDSILGGVRGLKRIIDEGITPQIRQEAYLRLTSLEERHHLSTRFTSLAGLIPIVPLKGPMK